MICERCGSKGRNVRTHVLRVTYESGNGFVYNLCSDCVRDIERFIKTEPRFNGFGYNLDFEKNCEEVYKENDRQITGKLEQNFPFRLDCPCDDCKKMCIKCVDSCKKFRKWKEGETK